MSAEPLPGAGRIQCPLCGYLFPPEEVPEVGCRLCPLRRSCDALVCPNCGYCQPSSTRTELLLRRLFGWLGRKVRPSERCAEDPRAVRLREVPAGSWVRVVALNGISSKAEARLAGFCILPGVVLQVRHRRPAYVVRIEETTVALEPRLAERIWARILSEEEAGALGEGGRGTGLRAAGG